MCVDSTSIDAHSKTTTACTTTAYSCEMSGAFKAYATLSRRYSVLPYLRECKILAATVYWHMRASSHAHTKTKTIGTSCVHTAAASARTSLGTLDLKEAARNHDSEGAGTGSNPPE